MIASLAHMANICPITKSGPRKAGKYANRTRATIFTPIPKSYKFPNLQKKTIYIPELKKSMTITASNKGFRTIKKNGAFKALTKAGIIK
jgi:large subunit ribosomal protein L28